MPEPSPSPERETRPDRAPAPTTDAATTDPPSTDAPRAPAPGADGASERPIVAFFDVDNTLMRGTSLFQLGVEAWRRGVIGWRDVAPFAWHQRRFITKGENHAHLGSARERALSLVGGRTVEQIRELAEQIWVRISPRLWPETVALAREHLAKGHEVWLISATPWEVGDLIARRLGLTGALGTRVEAEDGVYTGRLVGSVLHGDRKAVAARELAESIGADLDDSWAYSDSRNDIPLLSLVGHPVVVNPDAALAQHAAAEEWPVLTLRRSSIREARRRVKREARAVRETARRSGAERSRRSRKRPD